MYYYIIIIIINMTIISMQLYCLCSELFHKELT